MHTIVLSHEFLLLITPAKNETCNLVCVSYLGEIRCSYTLFFINIEVPENSGHQTHKLGMKLALFLDNLSFSLILCEVTLIG